MPEFRVPDPAADHPAKAEKKTPIVGDAKLDELGKPIACSGAKPRPEIKLKFS